MVTMRGVSYGNNVSCWLRYGIEFNGFQPSQKCIKKFSLQTSTLHYTLLQRVWLYNIT